MSKQNFSKMSTAKLKALLATASEEDMAEIEQVLTARGQMEQPEVNAPEGTESEEQTIEGSDVGTVESVLNGQAKSGKLSDEDLEALAEQCKANVGHRCKVVPFNTITWVDGVIAGVVVDKRSGKVLYAVKTDDGRRIVKVYNSNLIQISDETVELPKRGTRTAAPKVSKDWTPEEIAEEVNAVIGNVGHKVTVTKYTTVDDEGNPTPVTVEGRIVAIVPDKRAQRLLYRILVPTPTEQNPFATKFIHKVLNAEGMDIDMELDEEGAALNEKYVTRRETAFAKTPLTPHDKVVKAQEALQIAQDKLEKATVQLDARKQQLAEAQAEYDEWLKAQEQQPEGENEEEEPLD